MRLQPTVVFFIATFAGVKSDHTGSNAGQVDLQWPSQWVQTNQGATLRVIVQGSGPALTIIPSLARDAGHDFDDLASSLADAGYLVLRPQPRGMLGSVGATNASSNDLAADIADVIDKLAEGRSVVLGHAAGGTTAKRAAASYPDKIPAIIAAATQALNAPANVSSYPLTAGNTSLPDSVRLTALQKGFFAPGNNASIWLEGWYPETSPAFQGDSGAAPPAAQGDRMATWGGANTTQILEVLGAEDPFKPRETWNETIALFPNRVQQVVIQNASHALFPEQPRAVFEAILPWMEEQRARYW